MCILKVGVRTPLVTINILVPKATGPAQCGTGLFRKAYPKKPG